MLTLSRTVDECKPLPGGDGERLADAGDGGAGGHEPGRVVQVDPIKPTLKAPGTERLKL